MYDYESNKAIEALDRKVERKNRKQLEKENRRIAEDISAELDSARPKDADFDDIYPLTKINSDNYEAEEYLAKKGVNLNEKAQFKDGLKLEGIFYRVDEIELFLETSDDARYDYLFTEDDDFALQVFPAHLYDDVFNNTDLYCTLCNTDTDHTPIVFSIDCTTNREKTGEKMEYKRSALEISGATAAEYFKDMQQIDPEKQNFPLGRIEVMPHFVVGCEAGTADELAKFLYGFRDPSMPEKYDARKSPEGYKNALREVRTCVITELCEQTEANLEFLAKAAAENPRPEFDKLISDYKKLAKYFANTLDFAKQQGEFHQSYKFDPIYSSVHRACREKLEEN